MVRALGFALIGLAWILASPAAAQSRLFSDDAALRIVISAPFPTLVRAAPTRTDPFPATVSVIEGAGSAQSLPIQLRARGLTRRTGGFCQFPPLSLNFDKATSQGGVFFGQNKLKLVTYCRDAADYEQRIVLEFLAYRLYNLVTPMSFRVRGADITYRNLAGGGDGVTRFGFMIEDIDDAAKRNQRKELETASGQVTQKQLDAGAAARAALFEFMIGNLDWAFLAGPNPSDCCHNSRLIAAAGAKPATATGVVPLPYDFDYSGFVDAPYAEPPASLKVNRVTDRLYRGYCASNGEIPAAIEAFRARRSDMMALIDAEQRLSPGVRAKTTRFMEGFFAVLDDPERVQRQIVSRCR